MELAKQELQRFERAKERAKILNLQAYLPHLETIIQALKEIIALDDMFIV